ncbi:hypothetical protein PspLS_02988 [Pyricularia sp. CBS 133598]|nr:hypothetical protein PspLS_02988 [Pyricularia sp. CBS 133598]
MPKITRQSHNHLRYAANPLAMPASISTTTSQMAYYNGRSNSNMAAAASYYEPLSATHTQPPMTLPSFDPYAVAPPPPPAITIPANNFSHGLPTPSHPHRASSGAWSAEEDQTLLAARAQGLNWSSIQSTHFPSKTSNACRKRHERLMERRGADDWDARKLERLAQEYMKVRKEIWQPLARITGEKWNVVEQKIMANGIKNLQSAARHAARRERADAGHSNAAYDDDSGVSGMTPMDEQELQYSSPSSAGISAGGSAGGSAYGAVTASMHHPNATAYANHGGYYVGPGQHQHTHGYSNSVSSTHTAGYTQNHAEDSHSPSPYLGHGQRLPSVEMGIGSLIHRGSGSGHHGV